MNGDVGVRKRVILHIGMHKTGSSAIQHFLSRNRFALRAFGVLYPKSIGPDGSRQPKHNALFTAISHEADFGAPHPGLGPSRILVERLIERIERSGARTAILSAEGFSGEKPDFAAALAPLGRAFDVRVIAFLRRPDDWLPSFHRQMIMSRDVRETRSLAEFARAPETRLHLDYPRMLCWWSEAFGGDALRPELYEPGDRDLVRRFIDLAGAPKAFAYAPAASTRRNVSAPIEAVLARLEANRGDGLRADPKDLAMTEEEKSELLSRLKDDWAKSSAALASHVAVPPFIPLMLSATER